MSEGRGFPLDVEEQRLGQAREMRTNSGSHLQFTEFDEKSFGLVDSFFKLLDVELEKGADLFSSCADRVLELYDSHQEVCKSLFTELSFLVEKVPMLFPDEGA